MQGRHDPREMTSGASLEYMKKKFFVDIKAKYILFEGKMGGMEREMAEA